MEKKNTQDKSDKRGMKTKAEGLVEDEFPFRFWEVGAVAQACEVLC